LSSLSDEPSELELEEPFELELDEPFELELDEPFELEFEELFELEFEELFELEFEELFELELDELLELELDELLELELDEPSLPPDHQSSPSATRMKSSGWFAACSLAVESASWLASSAWSRCRAWAAPAVPSSKLTAAVVSQVFLFMGADSLLVKLSGGAPAAGRSET
jgi:hypothetical protein